ncbi:uncharacterized protein TNCT_259851 [Trichonephila clavata]|uniref:Uncharacterized protein n=1 Tax=Trichonephila clavata TaxID=2740835 RepID=A0A8X6K7G5_TRICU|nr:uncharacterized protein TNCT_259851 [Trichonephila clavata]
MEWRRMKPHEILQEYILPMRDLAERGSLDVSSLIENVIKGIPDTSNNKIILYSCKSIPEMFEKLFNASRNVRQDNEIKFDNPICIG